MYDETGPRETVAGVPDVGVRTSRLGLWTWRHPHAPLEWTVDRRPPPLPRLHTGIPGSGVRPGWAPQERRRGCRDAGHLMNPEALEELEHSHT
eukprot:scaffold27760_cov57-Phaeocystis_antarctica.AAC.3